jgi:hypothetical protein
MHTPGPWFIEAEHPANKHEGLTTDWYGGAISTPRGNLIYRQSAGIGNSEAESNARLIAAAPELLAALKMLRRMVEKVLTDSQLDHEQCGKTIRNASTIVAAAIAKAEGK